MTYQRPGHWQVNISNVLQQQQAELLWYTRYLQVLDD